jgi:hypothetical protein
LDATCGAGAQQMLVAGRVSLAKSGNKLIAHNTTAINWTKGTSFLLPLLFAPAAEFRSV